MAEELEQPTPSDGPGREPDPVEPEPVEPVEEPTEVEVEPEAAPEPEPELKPAAEVEPEPEPAKPAKVARQAVVEPDALDAEFKEALNVIDADDSLIPSEKAIKKLDLKAKWEERTERRQRKAQENVDTMWTKESAQHGVPAEHCETAWEDAVKLTQKRTGTFNQDYATALYHQKLDALKPAGKKPTQDPPKKAPAANNKGVVLPRGASGRVAPVTQDSRTVMERLGEGDPKLLKEFKEITEAFRNAD